MKTLLKKLPKEYLAEKGQEYELTLTGLEVQQVYSEIDEVNRLRKAVNDLGLACNELMGEYVSKKKPADWQIINDSLSEANALVGPFKKRGKK